MRETTTKTIITSTPQGKNRGDAIYTNCLIEHHQIPQIGVSEMPESNPLAWLFVLLFPICWVKSASIKAARLKLRLGREKQIIVIDHFRNAWLTLLPGKPASEILFASHNVESKIYDQYTQHYRQRRSIKALVYHWEYLKVRFWEGFVARRSNNVSVISIDDLVEFRDLYGVQATLVEPRTKLTRGKFTHSSNKGALILGSFHWKAKQINLLEFLEHAYSDEQNEVPLTIAGNMPQTFLLQLNNFISRKHLDRLLKVKPNFVQLSELNGQYNLGLLIDTIGGGFKLKAITYIQLGIPFVALQHSFPSNYQVQGATSNNQSQLLELSKTFLTSKEASLDLFNTQVKLFEDRRLILSSKGD